MIFMGVNLFNETTMGTFVYSYSLLSAYDITRKTVYCHYLAINFFNRLYVSVSRGVELLLICDGYHAYSGTS